MAAEELEKIEKIGRLESKDRLNSIQEMEPLERVAPNREQFELLLNSQAQQAPLVAATEWPEMSPQRAQLITEVQEVGGRIDTLKRKTPEEVMAQTKEVIAQVDDIKRKLKAPELKVDESMQVVMQNKLSHIDDKLRIALEKVGGEYTPLEVQGEGASLRSPTQRFLGILESSESQLKAIYAEVAGLGNSNDKLNPAALLALQIKVGYVQHELEFFTNVLNKSLESTKTLMNVQV